MSESSAAVRVRAPAKINLLLHVGPRRADGFHDLVTVFHAVDLVDEVAARAADGLVLRVNGAQTAGVPTDGSNLAARAAIALASTAGRTPDVELSIDKAIPVAGGMAGGSADAAAALVACNELWQLGRSPAELYELAAGLGSDVAFALAGRTAVGTGRGESLQPLPPHNWLYWVLLPSAVGLSTAAVYAEFDRRPVAGLDPGAAAPMAAALAGGDPATVAAALVNDLQPAALALEPDLAETLYDAVSAGALGAIVSGSGPTVAALARDGQHAADLAGRLADARRKDPRPVIAWGPAPGAQIMTV